MISHCILCKHREDSTIRLKPPTAGPRLLVLDGGGVRGAFTLLALKALEDNRQLPYSLREEFDLVVGTSSGEFSWIRDRSIGADLHRGPHSTYAYAWAFCVELHQHF